MIKAEGLMKKYGKRTVLKGVDIEVDRKEIVGLLGPNGAGKTTAFSLLLGLISSDGGSVFLDGVSLQGWPMYRRARAGIAFLPQESSIFRGLTVEENLLAVLETRREKGFSPHGAARQLMERFGLLALGKNSNPHSLASPRRQNNRTTNQLIRLARIDTQRNRHIDGLVKLGVGEFLGQLECLGHRIVLAAVDLALHCLAAFRQYRHLTGPPR